MSTITTAEPIPASPAPAGNVSHPRRDQEGLPQTPPSAPAQSLMADGLLSDLLDPNLTPIHICQLHNITPAQLRRITESDEYKQALEDIEAINANRRKAIHDQLRTEALASAAALIEDATKHAEDNRTNIAHPRQSSTHINTNPEAHRRALSAATRQHAANARLLETRRKAINTILRECRKMSEDADQTASRSAASRKARTDSTEPIPKTM